jgi:hypothetical protein
VPTRCENNITNCVLFYNRDFCKHRSIITNTTSNQSVLEFGVSRNSTITYYYYYYY